MHRFLKLLAVALLLITGLNAVVAGALFILDPSGQKMGMSTEYLKFSPFESYLLPGIVLFVVNGLLNLLVAVLSLKNLRRYPVYVILQGILLCGWILVQVLMVRDLNALHGIMFSIGILLILSGFFLRKFSPVKS